MDYRQFHSGPQFTPIGSMSLPKGDLGSVTFMSLTILTQPEFPTMLEGNRNATAFHTCHGVSSAPSSHVHRPTRWTLSSEHVLIGLVLSTVNTTATFQLNDHYNILTGLQVSSLFL